MIRAGDDGRDRPRIVEHQGIRNAGIDEEVSATGDASEPDADREIAPDFIAAAEVEKESAADVLRGTDAGGLAIDVGRRFGR